MNDKERVTERHWGRHRPIRNETVGYRSTRWIILERIIRDLLRNLWSGHYEGRERKMVEWFSS